MNHQGGERLLMDVFIISNRNSQLDLDPDCSFAVTMPHHMGSIMNVNVGVCVSTGIVFLD